MNTKQAVTTSRRGVVRCHCGAVMTTTDHCPCCGCEEHERVCEHVCARPGTRIMSNHADHNMED